jgi:endo-1,4-beta-xylanase
LKTAIYILVGIIAGLMISCEGGEPVPEDNIRPASVAEYNEVTEGLKDYYDRDTYFALGAAIEPSSLYNLPEAGLLKRHFNSLTAENVMKWSVLQPAEGIFDFTEADKIVAFAGENNMLVFGHTLCWHNQVPDWVFKDGAALASKELVIQRLRTHISTVMTHFKGKVCGWDVVNEAIDDGSDIYRNSIWYQICGPDYIFEAFRTAREADPAAKLFYNDYSATDPVKREKIYGLLTELRSQGLVDGMGIQGHWNIGFPSDDLITATLSRYRSAGVEVRISELDVSVYLSDSEQEKAYTTTEAAKQAFAYGRFFRLFRIYKNDISGVTMWGIADNHTWLDNFPVAGRKNYPLLFDTDLVPKQAYFTVINF